MDENDVKDQESSQLTDQSDKSSQRKPLNWNSPDHDPENFRLSLVEHLNELRTRILRCVWVLFILWAIAWNKFDFIYNFLTNRAKYAIIRYMGENHLGGYEEQFRNASDAFMNVMRISFYCALIIAFPFFVIQLWGFIAPGLKPEEQKPLRKIGPISLLLFIMGALLCWFILPQAYVWFASYLGYYPGVKLIQEAGTMALFSLKAILAFGIGFQLPLLVYILGALNLLSSETLIKYWRHATVAIVIIAGVITPSNDPVTMTMMALPLGALFAVSVYAVHKMQKKKKDLDEKSGYRAPDENKDTDDNG